MNARECIKKEREEKTGKLFCHTCLSTERMLWPIITYKELCSRLFTCDLAMPVEDMCVCWECLAALGNVSRFLNKVRAAQNMLLKTIEGTENLYANTLSTLTFKTTTEFDAIIQSENLSPSDIANETTENNSAKTEFAFDTVVKSEGDDSSKDMGIPLGLREDSTDIDYKATELLADIKRDNDDIKRDNDDSLIDNCDFTYDYGCMDDAKESAKRNKYRTYKYKLIKGVTYLNNYKKVAIDASELDYWLERDRESDEYLKSPYKCDKCLTGFTLKSKLTKHMKNQHSALSGDYACSVCDLRFYNKGILTVHKRRHFYIYVCGLCPYRCHQITLMYQHFKRDHSRRFQCLKCGMLFPKSHAFFQHYRDMHSLFVCDHCGKRCFKKRIIRRHIRVHHTEQRCDKCDIKFKNYSTYAAHHTAKHRKSETELAYCVECDKQFDNDVLYRRHVAYSVKHSTQRKPLNKPNQIQCPACSKTYSRKTFMMNHYRLVHLKKTKHYCVECDKYFLTATRIKEHMKYQHEGQTRELDKYCYICGRGFHTRRTLHNHIRTHTGERPHACPHCPAKFVQKYAMQTHVKTIHLKCKRDVQL